LFPLLLSLLPRPKGPVPLAVRFSLRLMVCVSAVSELVGVTRTILGSTTETADMSVVIMRTAADPYAILILTGLLFILALVFLTMTLVLGE
ncbi:MAG: hypothetical protein LUG57_09450, partial [Oscillospiraceae bacterium]|nr:hypothetical protein [Oscillospiraceae bacterium]